MNECQDSGCESAECCRCEVSSEMTEGCVRNDLLHSCWSTSEVTPSVSYNIHPDVGTRFVYHIIPTVHLYA